MPHELAEGTGRGPFPRWRQQGDSIPPDGTNGEAPAAPPGSPPAGHAESRRPPSPGWPPGRADRASCGSYVPAEGGQRRGFIDREYAIGSGRIDLLIRKPYGDGQVQREAMSSRSGIPATPTRSRPGWSSSTATWTSFSWTPATLVIFDRRPNAYPVHERTSITQVTSPVGRDITLLRA